MFVRDSERFKFVPRQQSDLITKTLSSVDNWQLMVAWQQLVQTPARSAFVVMIAARTGQQTLPSLPLQSEEGNLGFDYPVRVPGCLDCKGQDDTSSPSAAVVRSPCRIPPRCNLDPVRESEFVQDVVNMGFGRFARDDKPPQ